MLHKNSCSLIITVTLFLLLASFAKPVQGQDGAGSSKVALLIGINRYDDSRLKPLAAAVNDAMALRDVLLSPSRGDFPRESVRLICDAASSSKLPTRDTILEELNQAIRQADTADMLLVFFAGHGIEQGNTAYLLPSDANGDALSETAIPLDVVLRNLSNARARQVIFLVDACHSGTPPTAQETMGAFFARALFAESGGVAILSSCNYGEKSHEILETGHGAFTEFLLEALKGKADNDKDHKITLDEAYRYVWQKLVEWARQQRVKQVPRKVVNIVGDIVLTRCADSDISVGKTKKIPSTLAVLPFTASSANKAVREQTQGIAEALTSDLLDLPNYLIVERAQIDKLLQELKLSSERATDPRTAQQVGKILGAEWMVLGNVQSIGNQARLLARRVRTETSQIVEAWEERGTVSEFFDLQDRLRQKVRMSMEKIR